MTLHQRNDMSDSNVTSDEIQRLEREIWLFQQWLQSVSDEQGETAQRIADAYQQCIDLRKRELRKLLGEDVSDEPVNRSITTEPQKNKPKAVLTSVKATEAPESTQE